MRVFVSGLFAVCVACSGAPSGAAPEPAPSDSARLSPRILTEQAPRDTALLRPRILTEQAPRDTATLRPRILTERAPQSPRERLRGTVDSIVGDQRWRSAHWGVLVVDPDRGDTLVSVNAGKLFVPASNTKIITGAVALAQLGPDYRFTTRVLGPAVRRDGVLPGDLVVVGTGDPSVSDSLSGDAMAPLRAIADSLAARGVKRVSGRLISGANTFPDAELGAGWAWDDLDEGYSAPIDELLFNEGFARITVYGGARPGDSVRVRTAPATRVPRVDARGVTTVRMCCMERSRVTVAGDVRGRRPVAVLSGTVRTNDSVVVRTALRHPNAAFLDALEEALAARGIRVTGGVEADSVADTTGLRVLATRASPPLREILPAFEKPSQNQIGEVLLKTLGRERTGVGRADSGLVVIRRQLASWGIDSASVALLDGSGLTRRNFLTPEAVVRVLAVMRADAHFEVFFNALPTAGVDGTTRTRMLGTPAQANARAKTGTLDRVRNISGYVTTADGRQLIFSLLVNNQSVPSRDVEIAQDLIVAQLAALELTPR